MSTTCLKVALSIVLGLCMAESSAQYTEVLWKGRIGEPGPGRTWEAELILRQEGDSIGGFCNYEGPYYGRVRMPVRGYVDPADGSLNWWHGTRNGLHEDGREALDPMPLGIVYRLGHRAEEADVQSLTGKVSMTIWSGEKWEREVRLESSREKEFPDWVKTALATPPTTSVSAKPADKKKAATTPSPSRSSKSSASRNSSKPSVPPTLAKSPEPKPAPKPAATVKSPETPASIVKTTPESSLPALIVKAPDPKSQAKSEAMVKPTVSPTSEVENTVINESNTLIINAPKTQTVVKSEAVPKPAPPVAPVALNPKIDSYKILIANIEKKSSQPKKQVDVSPSVPVAPVAVKPAEPVAKPVVAKVPESMPVAKPAEKPVPKPVSKPAPPAIVPVAKATEPKPVPKPVPKPMVVKKTEEPVAPPVAQVKSAPPSRTTVAAKPEAKTTAVPDKKPEAAPVNESMVVLPPVVSDNTATNTRLSALRSRERVLVEEVVVHGDTLWLNFYDHAEVDGDVVSVYLGDSTLASNIPLGVIPHTVGIPVISLPDSVELTMYAENMGRIPPNTALLILYVAGERREVRLESTETASATIRFLKPRPLRR